MVLQFMRVRGLNHCVMITFNIFVNHGTTDHAWWWQANLIFHHIVQYIQIDFGIMLDKNHYITLNIFIDQRWQVNLNFYLKYIQINCGTADGHVPAYPFRVARY